jgi:hypothetical protein
MPIPLIWGMMVAFGFLAWSVAAAVHMASYMTAATRRSTQTDPRVARVQDVLKPSFSCCCWYFWSSLGFPEFGGAGRGCGCRSLP